MPAIAPNQDLVPAKDSEKFRQLSAPSVDFSEFVKRIDTARMYVPPLPITNRSEDRDGEIAEPDGLVDAMYQENPIVYFGHSHRLAPMLPPVGTSRTPEGVYDVHRRDDHWAAGCTFSQASKHATQTFALVAEGTIVGRSIGALDLDIAEYTPRIPRAAFHQGRIVPMRTRSVAHSLYELIEWSWVGIPSNREMTIRLKSVLSRDTIDGSRIDPGLGMVLKSFDLSEPTTIPVQMGNHDLRSTLFDKAVVIAQPEDSSMSNSVVGVRFDSKKFNRSQAANFLKKHEDLAETELITERADGGSFFRSVQGVYNGEVQVETSDLVPGVQFMLKMEGFGKEEDEEEDVAAPAAPAAAPAAPAEPAAAAPAEPAAEKPSVEAIVNDALADTVVQEGGDEAVEDEEVVEKAESGPYGRRWLKAMAKNIQELSEMASAGMTDLEPELQEAFKGLIEKCGEIQGEASEHLTKRYSEGGEEKEEVEEKEEPGEMVKAFRAKKFLGEVQVLPAGFMKSLRAIQEESDPGEKDRFLGMLTKGLVNRIGTQKAPSPAVVDDPIAELRHKLDVQKLRDQLIS